MKYSILIFFIFFAQIETKACEICGCANGFSFAGMMPQSNQSFLGIRYKNFAYESHPNSEYLKSKEQFHQTELWFRMFPIQKLQLITILPYSYNIQKDPAINTKKEGFADPSVLLTYNLLNTLLGDKNLVLNHVLNIGLGVKAPLGKFQYDISSSSEVANPNFQLGTGSWDIQYAVNHTARYKRIGLGTEFQFKQNGTNENGYRFGNRNQMNATAFYQVYLKHAVQVNPMVLYSFEQWNKDFLNGIENKNSGGNMQWLGLGFDLNHKRKSLQAVFQVPIQQNLVGGELKVEPRFYVQMSYFL